MSQLTKHSLTHSRPPAVW